MITRDELLQKASPLARRQHERNLSIEKALPIEPGVLINGQSRCAVSTYRMGLCRMANNGCAAIAVYNAMTLLGHKPDMHAIVLGLRMYGLWLGGLFGVNPYRLEKCLDKMRIPCMRARDYKDFENVSRAVGACILCYRIKDRLISPMHYVAVQYRDGGYTVCNLYNNARRTYRIRELAELCPESRFVAGFYIN